MEICSSKTILLFLAHSPSSYSNFNCHSTSAPHHYITHYAFPGGFPVAGDLGGQFSHCDVGAGA